MKDSVHHLDINKINYWLMRQYGKSLTGQPKFRIVWGPDQIEKRFGTFGKYFGKIFLGWETGVQERKKYAYMKPCYVIEQYLGDKFDVRLLGMTKEDCNGYEPLYAFLDKDGNELPINLDVVNFIMNYALNGFPTEFKTEDEQEVMKKRIEEYTMYFENEAPLLSNEGGVVVPHNYDSSMQKEK